MLHCILQPSLRDAIANHNIERVQYLFGCWCSVEHVSVSKKNDIVFLFKTFSVDEQSTDALVYVTSAMGFKA